jgi:hypothetical protein
MIDLTDPVTLAILGLIGTWILVVGTLILMWWQTRQDHALNSANAVMQLRERFDSERMRAARRHLSQKLLQGAHEDIASTEVLTFFELVGALTRRKLLDEDLVWEAFGTWVTTYYASVRHPVDLIGQIRTALKDPMVFHNLEWLAHRVDELDQEAMGAQAMGQVNQDLETRGFLSREAILIDHWAPSEGGDGSVGFAKLLNLPPKGGPNPPGPTEP